MKKIIEGVQYVSIEAYTKFADEQKLSRDDLQSVYETLPGAPQVKRLRNRPYAIEKIWEHAPEAKAQKSKAEKPLPKVPGDSKKAMVLRMLEGKGTTLDNLMSATGWQPHTTRGFLSTVAKKENLTIVRERVDGVTTYRLAA